MDDGNCSRTILPEGPFTSRIWMKASFRRKTKEGGYTHAHFRKAELCSGYCCARTGEILPGYPERKNWRFPWIHQIGQYCIQILYVQYFSLRHSWIISFKIIWPYLLLNKILLLYYLIIINCFKIKKIIIYNFMCYNRI